MKLKALPIALALLSGVVISSAIPIAFSAALILALISGVAYVFCPKEAYKSWLFLLCVFLVGSGIYSLREGRKSLLWEYNGKNAEITVIIKDEGTKGEYYYRYIGEIQNTKGKPSSEKAVLFTREKSFSFGDRVRVSGLAESIREQNNPNTFDFAKYYRSKGIYTNIQINSFDILGKDQAGVVETALFKIKDYAKGVIFTALPEREAGVLYGILSGDKSRLEEDTKAAYMEVGVAHILAVSGLHVGFLYMFLNNIFGIFIKNIKFRSLLVGPFLAIYVFAVGASPSALRALLMIFILMGARCYRENYDFVNTISISMAVLLLWNPLYIHDTGFIISFACVYSLAFLSEPIKRHLHFLPAIIRGTVAASLAIQVGTLPLIINSFNTVTPMNVLVNCLVIPLTMAIVIYGLMGLALSLISYSLSVWVLSVSYFLIRFLTWLVKGAALAVPAVKVPQLSLILIAAYYLFIVYCFIKSRKPLLYGGISLILISAFIFFNPLKNMEIEFLDVGQGDSTLIRTGENTKLLIDGGPGEISDLILKQGERTIDMAIITHFHDDHVTGIIDVLKELKVKKVFAPSASTGSEKQKQVEVLCAEKNIPLIYLSAGDSLTVDGEVKIEVLNPKKGQVNEDENETSLVLGVSYKDLDMLFCSDAGVEIEKGILPELRQYEILKVGHHGSRFSTSEGLLKKIKPFAAVIQVGRNSFGHPTQEVLTRLEEVGTKVYRNDKNGAVIVRTNGKKIKIRTME